MAERMNLALITRDRTVLYESKWGGNGIWEYLVLGCDYTIGVYENLEQQAEVLQTGCGGCLLIDLIHKNLIFYASSCDFGSQSDEGDLLTKYGVEVAFDKKANFFDGRQTHLHPDFIEFLLKIARQSWLNWQTYFADYRDFLDQSKFERNPDNIKSRNWHQSWSGKFPDLAPAEVLKNLQAYFDDNPKALHNLEMWGESELK